MCSAGVRARVGHERASSRLLQVAVRGQWVITAGRNVCPAVWRQHEQISSTFCVRRDSKVVSTQRLLLALLLKVSVPEDTPPWKDILQVSAQDADANSKLLFSIHNRQDQQSSALFHLDPKSGVLVLKEELDFETTALHTLVLMVLQSLWFSQGGHSPPETPPSELTHLRPELLCSSLFLARLPQVRDQEIPVKRNFAKVVVSVEDCNDHAPTFLTPRYEANVSRQAPAGSQVVRVKALDRDVGSNAEIRYSIVSGEHQQKAPCCWLQRAAAAPK